MARRTSESTPSGWKIAWTLPDLSRYDRLALDIETRDPDLKEKGPGVRRNGYIVGIAVGAPDGKRWYLPYAHEEGPQFEAKKIIEWAKVELCRPNQPKIGANILYDLDYLYHAGIRVSGPFYDVQNAEPLLDENRGRYNLDSLALEYLGEGKDETLMEQACEARGLKGKAVTHLWELPPQFVGPYAEADVDRTLRVFDLQKPKLKEQNLWDLFMLETRLVPLLLAMRQRGVRVAVDRVQKARHSFQRRLDIATRRLKEIAGEEVSYWANESVAAACDRLGVEYPLTKKSKQPSFTALWLQRCTHEFAHVVLECRKIDKFIGTFLEGSILNQVIGERVHCQFSQLRGDDFGTVTGRFSSSNPNLQFIPKRDDETGPLIRSFFIPEDGELWARADYAQIELRILAHYAMGEGSDLIRQKYREDPTSDYHELCANIIGIDRGPAKIINFGVVYGMGQAKLAHSLGLSLSEAKVFLQQYYSTFPFLKNTLYTASKVASNRGYIRTILNRRRRFPYWEPTDWDLSVAFRDEDNQTDPRVVSKWVSNKIREAREQGRKIPRYGVKRAYTYKALNAIIQGSAADLMKKAMVDIWESGVCDVLGAPLLTVHDELDWSIPNTTEGREAFAESVRLMENALDFKVPVLAEAEIKKNWGQELEGDADE